jgi:hypothetical protein
LNDSGKFQTWRASCEKQTTPEKARGPQDARVISTASFVGRFHFSYLKRHCAPIQSADQNIRPAGPPWRECALPGAEITAEKNLYAYGNMRRIFGASAGSTCTERRRWRMRLGFFVPSKCRLNACGRMILPLFVTRKRLAAPRCVFSLRTFGFAFDNSAPVALFRFHKTAKNLRSKDLSYIMPALPS